MTTDFRALCAELVEAWDTARTPSDFMDTADYGVISKIRAVLAEPKPEGPTDAEFLQMAADSLGYQSISFCDEVQACGVELISFARAILARWGRPAPQPVPVSDRLPGPGDCDAEGECYWFDPEGSGAWYQDTYQGNYTHWLPAHALPLPS